MDGGGRGTSRTEHGLVWFLTNASCPEAGADTVDYPPLGSCLQPQAFGRHLMRAGGCVAEGRRCYVTPGQSPTRRWSSSRQIIRGGYLMILEKQPKMSWVFIMSTVLVKNTESSSRKARRG